MTAKISNNNDVIIVGCGIAGSAVGALLSHMAQPGIMRNEAFIERQRNDEG